MSDNKVAPKEWFDNAERIEDKKVNPFAISHVIAVALHYQKVEKELIRNIVRCHICGFVEGEDEYFYKAAGERFFQNDPQLEEYKLATWYVTSADMTA